MSKEGTFKDVLESAQAPMLINDTNGVILESNEKAAELVGYSTEELLNRHFSTFTPVESMDAVRASFEEILLKGVSCQEGQLRRKDGTIVRIEASGVLVDYMGKKAVLILARKI